MQSLTFKIRTGLLSMMLNLGMISTSVQAEGPTVWINSHEDTLVSRSTLELSAGRLQRGIRTALEAEQRSLGETDRLIVNHNLCVALLQHGEPEQAAAYCTSASTAAQTYRLVRVRGAYYMVEREVSTNLESLSLAAVIMGNIYNNSGTMKMVWQTGVDQVNPFQGNAHE